MARRKTAVGRLRLMGTISVEGPHEQLIKLEVVAGGVGLERTPKFGGNAEIKRLPALCPFLLRQRDRLRARPGPRVRALKRERQAHASNTV